jgi:cytochrome c peroxidase
MVARPVAVCVVAFSFGLATAVVVARAQSAASLKSIPIPRPSNLARYVADEQALVVLGKALFWDVQVSSDNRIACASCHFHAGADHRRPNQLASADFPFSRSDMEAGRRVASAGIARRVVEGKAGRAHGLGVQRITPRNAPSVINAAHYFRAFWDGRASNVFTGRTPFGDSDPRPNLLVDRDGRLVAEALRIENASLASQAVAPPVDDVEMSCQGRTWPMLGRKLLAARPLARQVVAPDDSVLGPFANRSGRGLAAKETYLALVRAAFRPEYWRSPGGVNASSDSTPSASPSVGAPDYTQAEYNFSTFFGLAVQAYESTLISDDSPYDRFLDGDRGALTPAAQAGLQMFRVRNCTQCHPGPELTLATYSGVRGDARSAGLGPDGGFFYTGVEPIENDLGLGGRDGFGKLLSITGRKDPRLARWTAGLFKTPGLRNVELTGPYFHTGSKATLEQIVEFYTFAGDYPAPSLTPWGPDPNERITIPAFLKALTDDRVRFERAPFDHPELCVAIQDSTDRTRAVVSRPGAPARAVERWASMPPVGAKGNRVPLQTFEELLLGIGSDGSRAHHLTAPCSMP